MHRIFISLMAVILVSSSSFGELQHEEGRGKTRAGMRPVSKPATSIPVSEQDERLAIARQRIKDNCRYPELTHSFVLFYCLDEVAKLPLSEQREIFSKKPDILKAVSLTSYIDKITRKEFTEHDELELRTGMAQPYHGSLTYLENYKKLAAALGGVGSAAEGAVPDLVAISEIEPVRSEAYGALAKLGPKGIAALDAILRSKPYRSLYVVNSLMGQQDNDSAEKILPALTSLVEEGHTTYEYRAVMSQFGAKAIPSFVQLMGSNNPRVRQIATYGFRDLGANNNESSFRALIQALGDQDYVVQQTAAGILGEHQDLANRFVAPELAKAVENISDPYVLHVFKSAYSYTRRPQIGAPLDHQKLKMK